jgi:glyoxylase-like metal-dependent hydrolase (beta-lactamase superfamily II)
MRLASTSILITSLLLALTTSTVAQEITFKSTELSPGFYMIEAEGGFGGGNMAVLIGDEIVAMIDNGVVPLSEKLFAHAHETTGRPIDVLVNTHVHGDHTGANVNFRKADTVIFAHDNIRKRLLDDDSPTGGPGGLPDITYAEGVNWHIGDIEARIRHVPLAHTDGDSWVHFPEINIIHAGDVLFHSLFPYIDIDNGGTVGGYLAGMREILAAADDETQIIPGHGKLTDKAGMQADYDMLFEAYARVRSLTEQGMTADEIVATNPLAEYVDDFDWNFISAERLVRTIYRDLGAPND